MNKYLAIFAFATAFSAQASCPSDYAAQLLSMKTAGQLIREFTPGDGLDERRVINAMEAIDASNTSRFKVLLRQCDWPDQRKYGTEASNAAWLLVQHADLDVQFQKQALVYLSKTAKDGGAPLRQVAYLTDRVRLAEGHPQYFGTQFRAEDGRVVMEPIEDEANVDVRRQQHGLQPLSAYIAEAERRMKASK